MKKVKYQVSENEDIGCIPYGAIIEAYILCGNESEAVIYMPKKIKWRKNNESGIDIGCGSLSLACHKVFGDIWHRHYEDYINLDNKNVKILENKLKYKKK